MGWVKHLCNGLVFIVFRQTITKASTSSSNTTLNLSWSFGDKLWNSSRIIPLLKHLSPGSNKDLVRKSGFISFSIKLFFNDLSFIAKYITSAQSSSPSSFAKVVLPTPDGPIKIEHFFFFNWANKSPKLSDLYKFKIIAW